MKILRNMAPSQETKAAVASTVLTLVLLGVTAWLGYEAVQAGLKGRVGKAIEAGIGTAVGLGGSVLMVGATVEFWRERRAEMDQPQL
jgi:hypothetical protein